MSKNPDIVSFADMRKDYPNVVKEAMIPKEYIVLDGKANLGNNDNLVKGVTDKKPKNKYYVKRAKVGKPVDNLIPDAPSIW